MPVTPSAKKAHRQSVRRRARNLVVKRGLKAVIKTHRCKPSDASLRDVYCRLDKAAKRNVITKNKAARLKSQQSRLVSKKH